MSGKTGPLKAKGEFEECNNRYIMLTEYITCQFIDLYRTENNETMGNIYLIKNRNSIIIDEIYNLQPLRVIVGTQDDI